MSVGCVFFSSGFIDRRRFLIVFFHNKNRFIHISRDHYLHFIVFSRYMIDCPLQHDFIDLDSSCRQPNLV